MRSVGLIEGCRTKITDELSPRDTESTARKRIRARGGDGAAEVQVRCIVRARDVVERARTTRANLFKRNCGGIHIQNSPIERSCPIERECDVCRAAGQGQVDGARAKIDWARGVGVKRL